jgi:hypothetical protein
MIFFDKGRRLDHARKDVIAGVDTVKDRAFKKELKEMSDSTRLAALKRLGFEENQIFEERIMLNKEEIQSMVESGLVEFGAHTLTHPILPRCSDSKAAKEIQQSKESTEALTHAPCKLFSFPNGEYSERDIRICKKAGFEAALTLDTGFNTGNTDHFRLKRLSAPDNGTISELLVKASGAWAYFKDSSLFPSSISSAVVHISCCLTISSQKFMN